MSEKKKLPVTVYAESTPNPKTMKFVTNFLFVKNGGIVEFNSAEEAEKAPLAARLFTFPFVTGVFFSSNFITLAKNDLVEWHDVFGEIRDYLSNYLTTGHPVFNDEPQVAKEETKKAEAPHISAQMAHQEPQNDLEKRIVELLEEYVRPAVEADGGAIHFRKFEAGTLSVVLKGSCSGCPSSTVTLKNGIQGLFNQMMPEVKEVVAIEG
ncbi:MAG: NifU family protein [Flavobacteriales bacterium]|nr:NifU family protein [Flavobacteriales bacterium]